jgi:superfamily II DNA or RNA helicase
MMLVGTTERQTMSIEEYRNFLHDRAQCRVGDRVPFERDNPFLFDFQRYIVDKSLQRGSSAVFADCGLGKTLIELVWADNVAAATDKPVLILTPLAVSYQMQFEAEKFGIEIARSRSGVAKGRITVTNYEKLHLFTPSDFSAVVCDESSILKSFSGAYRTAITEFMKKARYRLLATATAAPNDYTELGTSSEALGYLGYIDMLNRFFKNNLNNSASGGRFYGESPKWRFKGHSEIPFWRWVTSWATACRTPSDLGFDDGDFILPPIEERKVIVKSKTLADGMLFEMPAKNLFEQRAERKRTLKERCEKVAELVDHNDYAIVWCHLNDEGRTLSQLTGSDFVEVSGSDSDDSKEAKLTDFAKGNIRGLITKPKIGAWGLNLQHVNHITYFPSHSYEQWYQAKRRCWRFGQKRTVRADIVMTKGDDRVMKNMERKSMLADRMFNNLVAEMNNHQSVDRKIYNSRKVGVPQWL